MRVDSSSTISIAGLSLILVLSSAGRGSAAPEMIVNESAFACHHHGKQLMLSCPMPRQAYHKEGVGEGRFFCDQSFMPPSAEISTWRDRLEVHAEQKTCLEIGRGHVRTPVTTAPHVCRFVLEKTNIT